MSTFGRESGDPDRNRTCDLQIRNLPLYPTELRDQPGRHIAVSARFANRVQRNFWLVPAQESRVAGAGAGKAARIVASGLARQVARAVSASFTQ